MYYYEGGGSDSIWLNHVLFELGTTAKRVTYSYFLNIILYVNH